jgi:hypothetical protein
MDTWSASPTIFSTLRMMVSFCAPVKGYETPVTAPD